MYSRMVIYSEQFRSRLHIMAISDVYMKISKFHLCTSYELCLMLGLSLPQALLAAAPSWHMALDLPSLCVCTRQQDSQDYMPLKRVL